MSRTKPLEVKLVLEDVVRRPVVLTGVNALNLVVGTHDGANAGTHRVSKGPKIQLVERPVVDLDADGVPVVFLLVEDVVLCAGDDSAALNSLYRLRHGDTSEIGVGAVADQHTPCIQVRQPNKQNLPESLPVPPSLRHTTERASSGTQLNIDALSMKLCAHCLTTQPHQPLAKRRPDIDASREGAIMIGYQELANAFVSHISRTKKILTLTVPNAQRAVLETKPPESESRDGACLSNTSKRRGQRVNEPLLKPPNLARGYPRLAEMALKCKADKTRDTDMVYHRSASHPVPVVRFTFSTNVKLETNSLAFS